MANQEDMPKVDFKEEKLKSAYFYSKHIEQKNLERAAVAKRFLTRKRIVFSSCLALVVSIYTYTLVKVKQEVFLDDFEEPARIVKND